MSEELKNHLEEEKSNLKQQPEKRKRGRPRKNPQPGTSQDSKQSQNNQESAEISFTPCPATAMIYKMILHTAFNQILLKGKNQIEISDEQCLQTSGAIRFILDHYSVKMSPVAMAFSTIAFHIGGVYLSQVLPEQRKIQDQEASTVDIKPESQQNA